MPVYYILDTLNRVISLCCLVLLNSYYFHNQYVFRFIFSKKNLLLNENKTNYITFGFNKNKTNATLLVENYNLNDKNLSWNQHVQHVAFILERVYIIGS